ncbi:MAG TPA: hypothetical protein VD905_15960, partial [Flavobacteriales bacterium]|nr:hypothetical protein [Flavobacteriales bacterium]
MKQRFFTWLFFTVQAYNLPAQTLKFYRADDSSAIFHLKISCTNTHTQIKRFSFTNESGEISVFSDTVNGSRVLVQADTSEFIFTSDTLAGLHNKTYYLKANPRTLSEVVITAQYAPGTVEKSVHRVNVIDRKKIDAMGAQNLRDVLTNELNIRLSQDNILGSS